MRYHRVSRIKINLAITVTLNLKPVATEKRKGFKILFCPFLLFCLGCYICKIDAQIYLLFNKN